MQNRHKELLLIIVSRGALLASAWVMLLLSVVVGLELDQTAPREFSSLIFTLLFAGLAGLEVMWLIVSLLLPSLRRNRRASVACLLISFGTPVLAVAIVLVLEWLGV